jgi:hypothetical protein
MAKLCFDCENATFSINGGTYCTALDEWIWDERVAEQCGLYEGPGAEPLEEEPRAAQNVGEIISFNRCGTKKEGPRGGPMAS